MEEFGDQCAVIEQRDAMEFKENDDKEEPLILYLSHINAKSGENRKEAQKPIEDGFDIIEGEGDQALISFYNDAPVCQDKNDWTSRLK